MSDTKLREKADALIAFTQQGPRFIAWVQAVTDALAPATEKAKPGLKDSLWALLSSLRLWKSKGELAMHPSRLDGMIAAVLEDYGGVFIDAPAPEKVAKVETRADRIAADLEAGTFRGEQPAPPEPAAPVNGSTPVGEYDPDMKPAAREMPEAVRVGTFQLEELLKYADLAEVSLRTGFSPPDFLGADLPYLLRSSIAAVRQQAAQGRKVELGKVRELIEWEVKNNGSGLWAAALAELDAAEGKRTAGEHMSELSGEPLPHYLRDARLTANGMRAAAEIARNFRPKSACTCGGYISFHYGIPCHQPGCLVGECLEIADEIDARADEIDETPDRWLAELDAAEGKGEGRG